jgi:L-ascorbate metabolism protein UlaG (beta-lactamase superfamily)
MKQVEEILNLITVNAHSSVRIEAAGKTVYVDPFSLKAAPQDADVIFLTHEHFDHFSPEDIARVGREDTLFVLPETIAEKTASVTAGRPVLKIRPGQAGEAAGIPFEAVRAYNPHKQFHPRERGWVGYVLNPEGLRIYIAGDTDLTPEAEAVRCDIALLPIGGKYTMNAAEAAALANRIRPAAVIPIHYGSVAGSPADFERFAAGVAPGIRVVKKV